MVGISACTPAAYRPRVRLPSGPRGFSTGVDGWWVLCMVTARASDNSAASVDARG